ncbi:MAG: type I toxin-antitoxin system SymE family toxin [bacterium]|nr:type I toxin-antitoxin system SymE family toxin [bacterium]
MKTDKEIRYLTIQKRRRKCSWLVGGKIVPEIRISGIWLARKGFFPHQKIKVSIGNCFLGIETIPSS